MKNKILLYGANGYTGRLIIEEAIAQNLALILAGRNEAKLSELATKYNLQYRVFDLAHTSALEDGLKDIEAVMHAAGPFKFTAQPMLEACIKTGTHYLDISGEYEVYDLCASYHQQAVDAGIMVMPGTGFDVVPSDCLALHMKGLLQYANRLKLAFVASKGGLSRGTSKTMVENMGKGGMVRIDHKLHKVSYTYKTINIDFFDFKTLAVTIPWGDISSAYKTTGIPNIEVYTGVEPKQLKLLKRANKLGWLLRQRWLKNFLIKRIDKRKEGPDEEQRNEGKTYFWGKVSDNSGNLKMSILTTPSGYKLTAMTAVLILKKVMDQNFKLGYQTPALAYGEGLILEIPGCELKDLKGNGLQF